MGPDYAHAEARKSPALDGKVERDKDGKEVRYPVILSAKEKAIARQVCLGTVLKYDLILSMNIRDLSLIWNMRKTSVIKTFRNMRQSRNYIQL